MWRHVGLRGAGFPARLASELADPIAAEAADRLLDSEDRLRNAREAVLSALSRALDALRAAGRWSDKATRHELLAATKLARNDEFFTQEVAKHAGPELVANAREAVAKRIDAQHAWEDARERARALQSQRLTSIADMGRFREALILQNRRAYQNNIESLRMQCEARSRNKKQRQREELAARYLARYTLKNDTISFFGPMGWGEATGVQNHVALQFQAGPTLLSHREVFLEDWAVRAIATALENDPNLKRCLPVRRTPHYRLERDTLILPHARFPLSTQFRAIIERVERVVEPAHDLAAHLTNDHPELFQGTDHVYQLVDQLAGMRILDWGFRIPAMPEAYRFLKKQLAELPKRVAATSLERIERIDGALEGLHKAAGDAEAMDEAHAQLEDAFTELAGVQETTRKSGEEYAGRTLVFEESVRDVELSIGPELVDSIMRPLSIIAQSARWLSSRAATVLSPLLEEVYRDIADKTGETEIDAGTFQLRMFESEKLSENLARVGEEFRVRWQNVVPPLDEEESRIGFTSEELRERVNATFVANGCGWPYAVHHSPDVMIAAPSVDSVNRGEYELVLGEFHPFTVTLQNWAFVQLSPVRDQILGAMSADLSHLTGRFLDTELRGMTGRIQYAWSGHGDLELIAPLRPVYSTSDDDVALVSDFCVVLESGELYLCSRSGGRRHRLLDLLGQLLSLSLINHFTLFPYERHRPRVTVDKMVVARESWRVPAEELTFAGAAASERFVACRRWARELGLPRRCFYSVPRIVEGKPQYLDFDSLISVDMFAKTVRRTASCKEISADERRVVVSEMRPSLSELWLEDHEGERYTSEMRLVMVDLKSRGHHAAE